jgi:hypothetical protein
MISKDVLYSKLYGLVRRHEHSALLSWPIVHLVVHPLQFHKDFFRCDQIPCPDEALDPLPEGREYHRRIRPSPCMDDRTRIEAGRQDVAPALSD